MATVKQILFRLGTEEYGLHISCVDAIERNVNILWVPNAPKHIAGIMNLRGEAIPVYDLRTRFGMPAGSKDMVIIARIGGMKIALSVDEVSEIVEAEEQDVIAAPSLVQTEQTGYVSQVTNVKGHMFLLLNLEGLLLPGERKAIEEMLRAKQEKNEEEE